MAKFKLAFGVHNHQPIGNFTAVFDEAHTKAYVPFLEAVAQHPDIRISLHQSGILWEWQKRDHPEYFEFIGKLVDSGQVELLTGGYFEPILTSIPARDTLGQIALLKAFLQEHFGVAPRGLWLTERVWEPHLPKVLADAGVEYLPIDDTHFLKAGYDPRSLTGPFVTEDEGQRLLLIPIQKRLRYLIPFGTVDEIIAELRRQAEERPDGLAVYADDGEKFGVWPKTYKHCYEERWMDDFLGSLERCSDWLEVVPLSEAALQPAAGRAYLPSGAYEEMQHWSLPPSAFVSFENFERWLEMSGASDEYSRFVTGGHWRGFLAKYDESNLMHKKMLRVSEALHRQTEAGTLEQADLADARRHLYAAQCNCPYWHGVFGGLYLPHIRQAVYSNLIEAHRHCVKAGASTVAITTIDYDYDGFDEVVADSEQFSAVFKPRNGGILLDLALNNHNFCVTDTLRRRREGYHIKLDRAIKIRDGKLDPVGEQILVKSDIVSSYLVEDWYLKRCFIDHFFTLDVELEAFHSAKFGEEGDFVIEPYEVRILEGANRVILSRDGHLWRPGGRIPLHVTKEFTFTPGREVIQVDYLLSSSHPGGIDVNFAVENNFSFQAGHAEDRFIMVDGHRDDNAYLDSVGWHADAHAIAMVDDFRSLAVAVASEQSANIWHLPIFTVSLSEGGFEKVYQGTTLVHRYRLHLSDETTRLRFALHAGVAADVIKGAFKKAAVKQ